MSDGIILWSSFTPKKRTKKSSKKPITGMKLGIS
jgi:hypothetical protein